MSTWSDEFQGRHIEQNGLIAHAKQDKQTIRMKDALPENEISTWSIQFHASGKGNFIGVCSQSVSKTKFSGVPLDDSGWEGELFLIPHFCSELTHTLHIFHKNHYFSYVFSFLVVIAL